MLNGHKGNKLKLWDINYCSLNITIWNQHKLCEKGEHEVLINQEFVDIPGVNLRKGNVEINIYVASLGKPAISNLKNSHFYI